MLTVCLADVLSPDTFLEAWEKVYSNQGAGGIDGVSLHDFKADLEQNLITLRNEVEHDSYHPLPLLRVEIDKPSGDGKRLLSIPTIRDRILQNFGTRVQYSVFECFLDANDLDTLKQRIEKIIDPDEDHVRYYGLCGKDIAKILMDGQGDLSVDEDYHLI